MVPSSPAAVFDLDGGERTMVDRVSMTPVGLVDELGHGRRGGVVRAAFRTTVVDGALVAALDPGGRADRTAAHRASPAARPRVRWSSASTTPAAAARGRDHRPARRRAAVRVLGIVRATRASMHLRGSSDAERRHRRGIRLHRAYLIERYEAAGWQVRHHRPLRRRCAWGDTAGIAALLDGAELLINLAGKSVNCRYTAANRAEIFRSRLETTGELRRRDRGDEPRRRRSGSTRRRPPSTGTPTTAR